ncbi:MAG: hypothetical protein Q8K72_10805, partial [Acidimicrobiales bacterium]|nr:hypothetical protein [Acidimicrobiales bacterium]
MTRQQKFVPIGVLFIMALALVWTLIPFNFANVVDCEAPLFGAEPKNEAPPTSFIRADEDCLAKGKSRLLVSAVAAFIAASGGLAMVAMKPISSACSG